MKRCAVLYLMGLTLSNQQIGREPQRQKKGESFTAFAPSAFAIPVKRILSRN